MTYATPPNWVTDAIFYQIFPDRFARSTRVPKPSNLEPWDTPPTRHGYKGGDLLGVVEHLDYLQDLGINAIYLNPIFQSASNHRYHTHDYYQVDPLLGGNEAFRTLLNEAHRRGIRIIIDGVFNHVGRGFFQFNDILENGTSSPWVEWFIVHRFPPNAYQHSDEPNYEAWAGLHPLPKLNHANPEVREFIMQVAEHWIREGIDGWRLDVPQEITVEGFWEEFRERVKAINPEAYLVGEIWQKAPEWLQGSRFDALMNYPLARAIVAFTVGPNVQHELVDQTEYFPWPPMEGTTFAEELDQLFALYPWPFQLTQYNLLGSHDTARILSIANGDEDGVRLALLLLFTLPGAPAIYYGDEIGMTGGKDPDCRRTFPWEKPETWNLPLLNHYRTLSNLRHRHPALRTGTYHPLYSDHNVHAFLRQGTDETILTAVNTGQTTAQIAISPSEHFPSHIYPARLFGTGKIARKGEKWELTLPPRNGGIWGWMGETPISTP